MAEQVRNPNSDAAGGPATGSFNGAVQRIDVQGLASWRERSLGNRAPVVLDVRGAAELALGQIPGAVHAPPKDVLRVLAESVIDHETPLVVYCERGVRSLLSAEQLAKAGYRHIYSLDGGFTAWKHAGFPVVVAAAGEGAPALTEEQLERYSRNLRLPQIDRYAQRRLLDSKALLVGLGGLGTPAALYLAAVGVGTLGLLDDDSVELSNLQRQILHSTSRIGMPKVESAARVLTDLNRDVTTIIIKSRLTEHNVEQILGQGWDIVIDGSDNYATRYLLNDACTARGIPIVFGSVQGFEGRVTTVIPGRGPCYRCAFPKAPPEELTCSCDAAGVLGVLPGVIGVLEATEAVKVIAKLGEPLIGRLLHYDALAMRFLTLNVRRDPDCEACKRVPTDV